MVDIRSGFTFYLLKKRKESCFVPANGTFYFSTDFCITVQAPNTSLFLNSDLYKISNICHCFNHQGRNRIIIQPNRVFFHHFETTFMNS